MEGIAVTPANYVTRTSGGVRIKEVKDCPSSIPSQCLIKEYSYTPFADPNNSSGRIVTNGKYYYPVDYYTLTNINASALYLNSASQLPLSTTLGHYVGYKTVIVKEVALNALNQKIYKGKTVFDYKSPDELDSPDINSTNYPYVTVAYDWLRGVVTQNKVYDQAGDWVKHDQNDYTLKTSLNYQKFTGLKAGKFIHNTEIAPSGSDPNIYNFRSYPSVSGFQFNQQSINREQFIVSNTLSSIESTTDYVYGNDTHLQATQISTTSSKGETLVTQLQYPHDINAGDLAPSALALRTAGRQAELLQTETFRAGNSISKAQNFYNYFGGILLPSKQRNFIGGSTVSATETQQLSYDSYGNLTSFREINGITHSFMWGYKGQYPVVYMMNGVAANPSTLLAVSDTTVIKNTANTLRMTFPNAHISHYFYQPMIGLSAQVNPAQIKTSFAYDGLNRLEKVFDHLGFILKGYQYQVATSLSSNNYVKEMMPRTASTTLLTGYQNVQTTLSYVDGLGRQLQIVAQQAGADGTNDIVSNATTYDGYGRVAKTYIPYPNAGNGALASLPASFDGDTRPYSENILFDNSPLNRLFQVQGVGQAWATANKMISYQYKVAGTEIRNFVIQANGSVDASGTYPAGSLYSTEVIGERGFSTFEIKDKEGKIIAKFQQLQAGFVYAVTNYVYDQNSFLRFVIPPEASNKFGTGVGQVTSFTENDNLFLEGMYGYRYTNRGLLAEKHIPGAGWARYVYDKINRVVLENDDKDAVSSTNFYKFTKYDSNSRPIQTGLINNIGNFSRTQLQADFDNHSGPISEERGTGLLGYTNVSFPSSYTPQDANVKEVMYYDNYSWQIDINYNFKNSDAFHTQQTNAKGMISGKLSRNLRTNTWQKMVFYYDYKGRIIQNFHLTNRGNLVRKDNQYSFNGELLKTRYIKTNSSNVVLSTKIMSYQYDHFGRKKIFKYSLNGLEKTIASYSYDATGRMSRKQYSPSISIGSSQTGLWVNSTTWQGSNVPTLSDQVTINQGHMITIQNGQTVTAGTLFDKGILQNFGTLSLGSLVPNTTATLQTLNYKYHIRGGLKGINLDVSGNLTNSIFSYRLDYEEGTTGLFDGNIKKQYWKSNIDGKQRSFDFLYDGASRLKSATYTSTQAGENYSLNNVDYDGNGNILSLSRNGLKSNNTFGLIDNLNYTYNANSNKILKVDDASSETASFKDVSGNDYDYWADGSLKKDSNKEITQIDYNYLKLPEQITLTGGRWIKYDYDANGTKLRKTLSTGQVTDYEEDEIYENSNLYQTSHDEGRIVGTTFEYNITDHLGNLRVAFKDSVGIAKVVQYENSGVFGESLEGINYSRPTKNNFSYSTYEKENDFGINVFDAHSRVYDATVPRFWQQDIKSEKFYPLSNYSYSADNPINFMDPNGEDWTIDKVEKDGKITYNITINAKIYNQSGQNLDMSGLIKLIKEQIQSIFSTDNVEGDIGVNTVVNLEAVSSLDKVKNTDHLFLVESNEQYDKLAGDEGKGTRGMADIGGLKVIIPHRTAIDVIKGNNKRTIPHEFGHTGGLYHPGAFNSIITQGVNTYSRNDHDNLMYGSSDRGNSLKISQIEAIYNNYQSGRINQQTQFNQQTHFGMIYSNLPVIYFYQTRNGINYNMQRQVSWKDQIFGIPD